MLNSIDRKLFKRLHLLSLLVSLTALVSCLPQATTNSVAGKSSTTTTNGNNVVYGDPTYPLAGIFVQEGATQTTSNLSLPLNFSDSFLVRGKNLSQYLKTIPNTTAFCLVGKYKYVSGQDRFLILTAKSKSYTDLVKKTTEFYLQVEPANDQSNQNDCLTYNLTNSLFAGATSPTASFSLGQLCANCTSSVTSEGLKLYFVSGEQIPTLTLNTITITISGSTSTSTNSCSESSVCTSKGYDCCLDGQCIKDGAVKPTAISDQGFLSAQADVAANPDRFVVYPQYYYICSSTPATTSGSSGGGTNTDPDYAASVRLLEMQQLYQCLNKVDGEFSYCTIKYTDAQNSIKNSTPFSAGIDDINFSSLNSNFSSGDYARNVVKINYAGQIVYEANKTSLTNGVWVNSGNDDTTTSQSVKLTMSPPTSAKDDTLYLTYKIDGTCEKMSASLAKCTKTYIQSHSDVYSSYYHDSSKTFKLPSYADLSSMSVIVKIGGVTVPEDASNWTKLTSPNRIVFATGYSLYQNQTIEITYYVTSGVADLIKSKTAAQSQVNSMCTCGTSDKCNLKPVLNTSNVVINYECVYSSTTSEETPANQTVYVSNKNIPHRYFDLNGVNYDDDFSTAPQQEGVDFSYKNGDVLKPSNVSNYTGFNEIYGSFSTSQTTGARPAKKVKVKKNTNYDIYVNSGVFSTCLTCGTDYYSSLQKIFPQNFSGSAGGYAPDNYESRRETNSGVYRADDLLFGRACFVPATMIPWTHISASTSQLQRQTRLAGQHFMFANGYNRDWYGFDYGSLIGSFDGVTWFSIGNARRIKATTNRLYLATNAYFGDLNVDNSFNVTVSESSAYSTSIPDHDTETDGAQCQRSHFCSNDNDCIRQLGYDYTCQNVSSLTTNWPTFDANATESVGSTLKTLSSIVGGVNGQSKRCVYRGRGAPCHNNLLSTSTTFNGSGIIGTLNCSSNNMCQSIAGSNSNRFNDRIARFANTPVAQNNTSAASTSSDTVGLGARILGRPFDYYGTKTIPSSSLASLGQNIVYALCIPGKDIPSSSRTYDLNMLAPSSRIEVSDKLFGVGPTISSAVHSKALNACPATDATGTLVQQFDLQLGVSDETDSLNVATVTQNMSSNLLDLAPLTSLSIFSSTNGSLITSVGYQRNTCLRAPGASCFTDMECAPSSFIANKARPADLSSYLNTAEEKFWEEEMICGNPDFKYLNAGALNPSYDLKKNVCCRDFGKTITVYTQTDTSVYKWCDSSNKISVAGLNKNLNSTSRYSRVHTGYDKMTCDTSAGTGKPFALSVAASSATQRFTQILQQYKTLDTINQRTCCTQNWVRSFHSDNGGGHKWARGKTQPLDKTIWTSISWLADNTLTLPSGDPDGTFDCASSSNNYANASCEIKSLTQAEEDLYLNWAGSLELIGIPQVAIKTNELIYKIVDDVNPATYQQDISASKVPLKDTIQPISAVGADFTSSTSENYYSAASYSKFQPKIKKIFSESEFNCCIPSGKVVPDTTTAEQCCTGYLANTGSSTNLRCCLPDYTDVSLYLNRYVSSEGRGLTDSSYDTATGYIKDKGVVQLLQAQKNLCCSGKAVFGYAISRLPKPVDGGYLDPTTPNSTTRRFVHRTDVVDNNTQTGGIADLYDAGVRWNNHLYCVPANFTEPPVIK